MASIDLAMQFSSADPLAHFDELRRMIQKQPQRSDLRVFLFQIYCVQSEWVKAATQLDVLLELDPSAKPMVETYREALRCEVLRRDVFDGKRSPLVLGAPQDWLAGMLEALRLDAQAHHEAAAQMRARALDEAPATSGTLDGAPFAWLADADSRIGPVLEAIINGKYYWVPISRLMRVEIDKPADLRDFVWTPATLTLENGAANVALIPTRYPATEKEADAALRLARATDWREKPGGAWHGVGQRMLTTDQTEIALLDLRVLTFDVASDQAGGDLSPAAAEGDAESPNLSTTRSDG
ncbi:MAG: type VI secretion system accessory protein TagJ [Burkholderiaceae bacterium]